MDYFSNLSKKIGVSKVTIGVIGLGYVGLPLALQFAKKKLNVIGFDLDQDKINKLKRKSSYIKHISDQRIKETKNKTFFTNNFKFIQNVDIIILCLPTPLSPKLRPDLSYIKKTIKNIKKYLIKGQLLILESSTYPGSTKEIIGNNLKTKFIIGENFFLGYSPEREDPNNKNYNIENIPKICSGYSNKCLMLVVKIYKKIIKKLINVSSIETAEFTKLYENVYRSVNIGLVNELKILSNKIGLNIYEIINAAKTKPFGFQPFYPGPGVGGHCIPVDPYYLSWVAKKNNINTNLIFNAGKINSTMPSWIIKESLKNKKIRKALIIGVSYKKNVDDTRESPAIDFIKILKGKKIKVDYYDPIVKTLNSRKLKEKLNSIKLDKKKLLSYDITIIVTDHDNLNYSMIKKCSKFIIDTRNIYKKKDKKIINL